MDLLTLLILRWSSNWASKLATDAAVNKARKRLVSENKIKRGRAVWPSGFPQVNTREYISKWLKYFARLLKKDNASLSEIVIEDDVGTSARSLSILLMSFLNKLNGPLYWAGILFGIWMFVDIVLQWFLNYEQLNIYSETFSPILATMSPAIVGYWTNYIAIKMLFHPQRKNAIWWGLVPARKNELVETISQAILDKLISPEIVQQYLEESKVVKEIVGETITASKDVLGNKDFREETKGLIYGYVYNFVHSKQLRKSVSDVVRHKIEEWTGRTWTQKFIACFKHIWGPPLIREIETLLPEIPDALTHMFDHLDKLLDRIPLYIEKEGGKIEAGLTTLIVEGIHSLEIKSIVKKQLDKMDESQFEKMLTGPVSEELRFIMTSGGLFGVIVGMAIAWPWFRVIVLVIVVIVFLIYRATLENGPKSVNKQPYSTK